MINHLPFYMLRSLIITIAFELTFAIVLGIREKRDILYVAFAQIATNPLVVSVSMAANFYAGLTGRTVSLIFLEAFAVIFEGFIYQRCLGFKKYNAWLLSLMLNAFSFTVGELINLYM